MTALCVQVNVLYASEMSWPLKALPRRSNGWYQELWPPSVNWERAVSGKCEDDRVHHRPCLSPRSCCKGTKWRKGEAPYTFEQSGRNWIRQNGNHGVQLMLSDTDISNANTNVLIVGMGNSHSEMNGRRMLFIKLSRICLTHPCNETELTSVRESREPSCKSPGDHARESQLNTSNSSKSVNLGNEHRTAREVYDRGKMSTTKTTKTSTTDRPSDAQGDVNSRREVVLPAASCIRPPKMA